MATESSTNATSSSWEYLYGQKVWAKWKKFYWPCLCYDPSQLGNVDEKLLQRSVNSVGRRYTLRYLGMSEIAAYGFISKNDVKIYEGLEDTLLNQDPSMVNKKYSKSMEEGLKLMRLEESVSYKFHEARNLERSRDPSRLDAEENDDDDSDNENYKGDDDDQIVNHVLLGGPVRIPKEDKVEALKDATVVIKKKPGRKPKALTIDTCDSMFTPNYFTTSSSTGASASGGDQLPRKRGRPRLTPLTQSSTNITTTTTTTTTDGELTTTTSTMNPDPSEGEVSKKRGRKKKIVESVESVEPTVRRKPGRPWKRSKPDDVGGSQDRESNDDGNMDESLKRGDDDDGSSEDDDGESNEDEDSDSDEESEYEEKDDNIRPPVSKRSGPRGVSKLSINDDEEDDDDNHDGNYNRNDENKRTEKVVATTSYARTTIPSVDSHSSDTLQSKLTDDEKLTKYLAFLDKIVAQKDPIISQQERQVLKVIHAISKLQVVFTPELLKQVAVFGQLKNHVVPEIANAAKVQVKLWKTQNAEDISRLRRESAPATTTTTTAPSTSSTLSSSTAMPASVSTEINVSVTTTVVEAELVSSMDVEEEAEVTKLAIAPSTNPQSQVLSPLPAEIFDAELLPMSVQTETARRRAVKLLMSVSVPRHDVAIMLEQMAYKIFVISSSTYNASAATEHTMVTPKYTACITRLAFALLEPELEPIRNRLLRLTTVTPTTNTTSNQNNSHSSGTSMSEKEWYNLCVMDLSKLFALSGH